MAKRATISDVAKQAGFSISTVSMVLNNKKVSFPQSTRDAVMAAAKKLNYRPNSLAVSLITKRSNVLGMIIPNNSNLFFSALLRAVEQEAAKAGYALICGDTGNDIHTDRKYINMFLDRQVDGVVLLLSGGKKEEILRMAQVLKESPIPVVAVDRGILGTNLPTLQMNHFKAGYIATRHLLSLGHKKIVCTSGTDYMMSKEERAAGYIQAHKDMGVPPDKAMFCTTPNITDVDRGLYETIIHSGATAMLAINDTMALDFYRYAKEKNISIPGDMSVIGSDDLLFADMLSPPLTTVRQPVQEIGKNVVKVLLQRIEGTAPPAENLIHQFEPELVIRESTAAPRKVKI